VPKSQFVSAATLMRLLVYAAVAFVTLLGVVVMLPEGEARTAAVVVWMLAFPTVGWWVYKSAGSGTTP
jgi:hypothetical protein